MFEFKSKEEWYRRAAESEADFEISAGPDELMGQHTIKHPSLKQTTWRYVVGWFDSNGRGHYSTWSGETSFYVAGMPPEEFTCRHLWDNSPSCPYYEFIETLSHDECQKIARAVDGTLVIAFRRSTT